MTLAAGPLSVRAVPPGALGWGGNNNFLQDWLQPTVIGFFFFKEKSKKNLPEPY